MKNAIPTARAPQERAALARLRQILIDPKLLRASLMRTKRRCGQSCCRCARDKRHLHVSWYVGQSHRGHPRQKCIPKELVEEVRQWVSQYREAYDLLDQVSNAYWERLQKYQR